MDIALVLRSCKAALNDSGTRVADYVLCGACYRTASRGPCENPAKYRPYRGLKSAKDGGLQIGFLDGLLGLPDNLLGSLLAGPA